MFLILLLALMFVGLAVSLALKAALGGSGSRTDMLSQVAAYGFTSGSAPATEQPNALQTREIANRIGVHLVSRLQADQARALRQLLNSAGYYRTTVTQYLGYRALAVVGLPLAVFVLGVLAGGIGIVTIVIVAIVCG